MSKKTTFNWGKIIFLFFLLPVLCNSTLNAQCAGEDASFSYCSKENGQFLDLFDLLQGNPIPGGVWSDNDQDRGLNTETGQLDTYAIMIGGIFEYTYTVNGDPSCPDNTSVITLTLGSYAGRDNNNAVVCADAGNVNLFQFTGSSPSPTIDGNWTAMNLPDEVLSGANNRFFDVSGTMPGRYDFMYTVPAYGDCPATSSTVVLEVAETPDSGTFVQPVFCESDDLSNFTNYNLRDVLVGEDPGGVWTETTTTAEISGPNDSRINIERLRNTLGPGTYSFIYTVNPINPTCASSATTVTILIEDVLDFSSAALSVTLPEDQEAICVADLPIDATGTLTVDQTQVPDGNYDITYTVRNGQNSGTESLTLNFIQGTADFAINPDFFTSAGDVIVEVTQIVDPNTQTNCQVPLGNVSDGFTINSPPDTSDTALTVVEPVCFGESLSVSLNDIDNTTIELQDGIYTITYQLTVQNNTQTQQGSIEVTNGTAGFSVPSSLIANSGDAMLTLTDITGATGCTTTANLSDTFTISPRPDATNLLVAIDDVCAGETITVNLNNGENTAIADGNYTLTYSLSGANTLNDQEITQLLFTAGTASFDLASENLELGTSTLTITNLQNEGTGCDAVNLNEPAATFSISPYPDLTASALTIASVCETQPVNLIITDSETNIPNGIYTLGYALEANSESDDYTASIEFIGGTGSVTLPSEAVALPTSYTLQLNSFENESQNCPALGLPKSVSFEIYENPDLNNASLTVNSVCFPEPVIADLSGATLDDGEYTLTYNITGSNTAIDEQITLEFVDGATSFTIPEEFLQNTGANRLEIANIQKENDDLTCVTETSLSTTFAVNASPVLDDTTLSLADALCLGDAATVNVTSATGNLSDGTYSFTYLLSGDNTSGFQSQEVKIDGASGSFSISETLLTNAGNTDLTVTNVTNTITGCTTDPENLDFSFLISLPPDMTGASLTVADFCAISGNQTVTVNAPYLTDGIYDFTYSLSGANTDNDTADGLNFTNGNGSFELPENALTNAGETTLMVTAVNSENCSSENLTIATTFTVNALPQLTAQNISVTSVCLGENTSFIISAASIEDGSYSLVYSLSGANELEAPPLMITISDGGATFDISSNEVSNAGTTIFTVQSLTKLNTGCESVTAVSTSFEIYPIPTLESDDINAMDICINEAGMLSVNSSSGLVNGSYTITYQLSGANNSNATTTTLDINNASGILEIPSGQLINTGSTTISIEEIVSSTGCSFIPNNASASFEISSRPDASGLSLTTENICLTSSAEVFISGATNLADREYIITYQLEGATTQTQTEEVLFVSGDAHFTIAPSVLENAGNTTISIIGLQDFVTQCGAANLGDNAIIFEVQDPEPPGIASDGNRFCINDDPTVSDLLNRLSSTGTLAIYDSETGGNTLAGSTQLVNRSTYYATQTSSLGCESSERLAITVDLTACDNIFVPEAFSPNGDGINDRFIIQNIGVVYPDYTIEVFNRNGNVVFKGNANSEAWDGTANQNQLGNGVLPNGVYFYIINYNDGATAPVQGNLYLNR
ncbi:gliding motility-associated C-terminal domain-containing protein [Flavimarina sp. Hel_I_48]|uniref:gliding motility-associated C-terminal domain-containing protein n=1 Tax=Flavimarina sp. Hel_I_48 TaxID=1392488 RepID=UPI0004DF81A6|nr:T9SS C-terminal target domain-containing protein [Flavimarina sp. Hel_I_48]